MSSPSGKIRSHLEQSQTSYGIKFRPPVWAALALAFMIALPRANATAREECKPDLFCLETSELPTQVYLSVKTFNLPDLTLTFTLELENMVASEPTPYTATFPAKSTTGAIRLTPINPHSHWSYKYHYNWDWGDIHAQHDESYLYRLPYEDGKRFTVTQGYNAKETHSGPGAYAVDFGMPEGTPVVAARDGIVVTVRDNYREGGAHPELWDRDNMVKIVHSDGTVGSYSHLRPNGAKVTRGQAVKRGEVIAYSGNTGYTTGPHLHFEVHRRIDAEVRETLPVRFRTKEGVPLTLKQGVSYTAVP